MSDGSQSLKKSHFAKICGLTLDDIKTLEQDYSIKTFEDIAVLEKEDFDQIFGDDKKTFLKRRRLSHAALYLRRGGVVDNSTTMSSILSCIHTPASPNPVAAKVEPQEPAPVQEVTTPFHLTHEDVSEFTGSQGIEKSPEIQVGPGGKQKNMTLDEKVMIIAHYTNSNTEGKSISKGEMVRFVRTTLNRPKFDKSRLRKLLLQKDAIYAKIANRKSQK